MRVNIEVSIGELIDKITILALKLENIVEKNKLVNVNKEYRVLENTYKELLISYRELENSYQKLKNINQEIWFIEDHIRILIGKKDFNDDYIKTANNIHRSNDRRFEIKNEINKIFNSNLLEQKSYPKY